MRLEVLQLNLWRAFGGRFDMADHPWLLASFTQYVQGGLYVGLGYADHHAYAAVQHAMHFGFGHVAFFLQPVEYRRALPAGNINYRLSAFWQNARDVVEQAATGDVGHGFDNAGVFDQLEQRLDVDAGRSHQQIGQRLAVELDVFDVGTGHFDDLADQRVTVGVRARRWQGEQGITGSNPGAVDDFGLLYNANAETGQVVVFAFVHARHFSGFAAYQRAAGQFTASADTGNHLGRGFYVELAGGVVIEEEQWLCAAHDQVVNAHCNQVDADAVVFVQVQCQAQLGTYTVGAGNQNRLLVASRNFAEGAKTAEMPGMYEGEDYDLAGLCVGVVEKSEIIDGSKVATGDTLIALPSSGPHSNGYSLIRKIIEVSGADIETIQLDGKPLSELLMAPTRIYVKALLQLIKDTGAVKAMAHITGGGLLDNIPRVLPDGAQAVIDVASWTRPSIFDWLQEQGNVDEHEMHRVLNCGVGMIICVAPEQADVALDVLREAGEKPWIIGRIENAAAGAERVVLNNLKSH